MTPSSARALSILRDPSQFQWYVIPLLVVVIYIYNVEIGRKNYRVVFAGLAFWGMDWFNEIWNALVFHFSGRAPVWGAPGETAGLILIGLNIEICLMFAVMGVAAAHSLPSDLRLKILGLPNRIFLALFYTALCVLVEIFLNRIGALTWEYSWWSARAPWLIFLFGYLPFFAVAFWVHDMKSVRRQAAAVLVSLGFDGALLLLFGQGLSWI